jgi:hypothetical protein
MFGCDPQMRSFAPSFITTTTRAAFSDAVLWSYKEVEKRNL